MSKKGAVISSSDPLIVSKIQSLNPAWYYTWGATNVIGLEDLPFVPMCWGGNSISKFNGPVPILLGFNEPDRPDQSNLTIQQALNLWPKLDSLAVHLGSPATAGNAASPGSWQEGFSAAGPRTDFMCLHWYAPPNVDSFLKQIDATWTKYQKPIWVTEFAAADWSGKFPGGFDSKLVSDFMTGACKGLEARSYVERYTWKTRDQSDSHMGTSALFKPDGTLTDLGSLYAML